MVQHVIVWGSQGLGSSGLDGAYLEVHCTYNLVSNCSYNPNISRVTVVMGLIFRL